MNISVFHENGIHSVKYDSNNKTFHFFYPCLDTWNCSPFKVTFPPGFYFLEVWGAQGGSALTYSSVGGFGGYSCGLFNAKTTSFLYLHIGGSTPGQSPSHTGYNGGASGTNAPDGPGGGATDFRTSSGTWDTGFESRIIVAGGGGGAFVYYNGSNGGGFNGSSNQVNENRPCYGTQNNCEGGMGDIRNQGSFGKGGGPSFGAGGGGYWGGGTANGCGGGGGSGYIGGVISSPLYPRDTRESDHSGNGEAKIHILYELSDLCNFTIHSVHCSSISFSIFCVVFFAKL